MFAARAPRNVAVASASSTMKTTGSPFGAYVERRNAVRASAASRSEMNGFCRPQARSAPTIIQPASKITTTRVSTVLAPSLVRTHAKPSAAPIGTTNPKVTRRSAGSHPVRYPTGTPTAITTSQEVRNRWTKPSAVAVPATASGTEIHWT
jgi:hypothetical protein